MAPTIKTRGRTAIGFTGTTGGSLSWINQAGAAGKAQQKLGQQIIEASTSLYKAFDEEMDRNEIQQQADTLRMEYSKASRVWGDQMRSGGSAADANGVPTNEFDTSAFTDIVDTQHNNFWRDHVEENQNLHPDAVAKFGAWFEANRNTSWTRASEWGRAHRASRMKANDLVIAEEHAKTIRENSVVEEKEEAFAAIDAMFVDSLEGKATHRDLTTWSKIRSKAQEELDFYSAYENALGQRGLNVDPNDLEDGYQEADYANAIAYLQELDNEPGLGETERKKLITFFDKNMKLRAAATKKATLEAHELVQKELSRKYATDKLTINDVLNAGLTSEREMYWVGQLEKKAKVEKKGKVEKSWKADFNTIKSSIQSGTYGEGAEFTNNVIRTPWEVKQMVRDIAYDLGIPPEETEKLMKDIDEIGKGHPITESKKRARKHAERTFKGKVSIIDAIVAGQASGTALDLNTILGERATAAEDRLYRFDALLDERLDEGFKQRKSWMQMLTPGTEKRPNPDYIVDDLIDEINETTPDHVDQPKEEPPEAMASVGGVSIWDDVQEWYNHFTREPTTKEYTVYGNTIHVPLDEVPEISKARVDSHFAWIYSGDPRKAVVFPEGHPGYHQYPDGIESLNARNKRLMLMGDRVKEYLR